MRLLVAVAIGIVLVSATTNGYRAPIRASVYASKFNGRTMANGHRFDPNAMTVASLDYPFGTKLVLVNPDNGWRVAVVVTDRGPYQPGTHGKVPSHKFGIDLSPGVAKVLGITPRMGWGWVVIRRISWQ